VLAQPGKEGKLCYMFAGWFAGAMDWVNDTTEAGKNAPRSQSKEVQCAAEHHAHCVFEVSPLAN
jgi:predicted hydrocarbon binding protein